ncbi:Bipolar DNA helicase [Enterobacter cloacae]|uniref:anti-phage-associated helicase HerA n=1 Tax=Enterobacter cloacae TaxID=550 RepID=UPI0007355859|nr:anti-phage-associated helicase HerA [Enterobacter cloacae]AVL20116.1 Bipolar DNA helicase [Enterobacter cloacae]KTJ68075.1 Bipolar DNA helicase [Enterobacter cloacae subsp. cloacae]
MSRNNDINAEVVSVSPNKLKISVDDLEEFKIAEEKLGVGSYLRVSDNQDVALLAIIDNFSIDVKESQKQKYMIEASPIGLVKNGKFYRGGDSLALPPKKVEPAKLDEIISIYSDSIDINERFTFSSLSLNTKVSVPVNGNRFFNKHIAIVGSTGSGKSHTVAKILQKAVDEKQEGYKGLNNSHIIIFDIHSEYENAFPNSNVLNVDTLTLPYWLLNGDELEELFLDTEANDHNQRNVFRQAITLNKKRHFQGDPATKEIISFHSPYYFDINEVINYINNRNNERKNKDNEHIWSDEEGNFKFDNENAHRLFKENVTPDGSSAGALNGKLLNFVDRLQSKIFDKRLDFILGEGSKSVTFKETLETLISYGKDKSNITILDVSGVPFEVLSICVSLISRLIFEFGYHSKKIKRKSNENQDIPILIVYEEAHKYAPKSDLSKYRTSKEAIERIAKEGRKYGVTLLLASQRPSEISETIFSQCNTFISMRLTNPDDQNYVKRLLPDTVGDITNLLPSLKEGEALIMGDSISIPSIVKIEKCTIPPSSIDIKYLDEWRKEWVDSEFDKIIEQWSKS